jgi:uroporphyrinogen decarboxylase
MRALVEEFLPDAIFPLMDLSIEANALGRYTVFPKADSATVVREPFHPEDIETIENINIAFDTRLLGYVETVKLMSLGLPSGILKCAYVCGPYTLAGLLLGADEAAIASVMDPEGLKRICRAAAGAIQTYVRLLIAAGARAICILEPSAVMLGPDQFREFSADFVRPIKDSCQYSGVSSVYHICGNSMHLLSEMAATGVDALSLDSREMGVDLPRAAEIVPEGAIIIGNLSPTGSLLRGSPGDVARDTRLLLKDMEPYPNFILSTGCDLPQEVPIDNIAAFVETGREYSLR